tara:strand:- start:28931 stop:29158 length:228 start_codon:yes stop_codon:yes gene_type:complete
MDDSWNIKKEKHLNPNNIIFKDISYVKLYLTMKKVDDEIKKTRKENKSFTMQDYAKKVFNLGYNEELFKQKKRDK